MRVQERISRLFYAVCIALTLLLALLLVFAGGSGQDDAVKGEEVVMRHSALLRIVDCDGFSAVEVKNPWGNGLLKRYLLVHADSALPEALPEGVVVRTPVKKALVFSGVHVALFEELGVPANIAAVCDAEYVYSDATARRLSKGEVVDCGSSLDVNMEQVAVASPDAAFVLPYENGGYGKMEKVKVPLIECADYMEISPLACAEWMRFYGRLLDKAAVADSIYGAVCDEYEALRMVAAKGRPRPGLLCELKSSSAWYLPAGGSTMGRMYADAGADYLFSHCEGSGSVPLSFELVLERAADADVWLVKYNSEVDKTYSSLLAEYAGYAHFKPFKEKNIYICNTRNKRLFEDRTFHPERMLKELVALFHPQPLPGYELKYYERMH